ncbi:hypothetical protein OJAV_G00186350 [Oryzias javanicus]|uniref:RH2 domain-containing protein n=1 Tax=Oryzias javanicus TaxID=123683 RepID=A0A3S2TZK0_ORYJA|nr:hypothetical protein OJAV_G00186350 [Oryzias javanicus]
MSHLTPMTPTRPHHARRAPGRPGAAADGLVPNTQRRGGDSAAEALAVPPPRPHEPRLRAAAGLWLRGGAVVINSAVLVSLSVLLLVHFSVSTGGGVPALPPPPCSPRRCRKERPVSMGVFQLPGSEGLTSDLHRDPVDSPSEPWRFNNLQHPRSNTSLKDELGHFTNGRSKSGSSSVHGGVSRSGASASPKDGESKPGSSQSAAAPSRTGPASSTGTAEVSLESVAKNLQEPEPAERQNLESDRNNAAAQEGGRGLFGSHDQESAQPPLQGDDGSEDAEPSEVQAIIESTPELDMDLEGCRGTSTPTKGGVENLAFNRNTDSLFEELSSAGNDLIADMDEGADLLGMGREVEHLIHENAQLLETKNALNVVKNDLIAQVDDLSCEKEVLRGELEAVTQAKAKLEEKNKELEEELKAVRAELEEAKQKVKSENEDDSDVPTAQRKRFTRVEMARVLMERNQYKERLMELQEAVRWTEMIRASKENPALPEKKKSSLWQFFSRLFSSSGGGGKKPAAATAEAPVNVKYNAPTSQIQPSIKKKSSALQQLPSDKSKAFDFLNEEAPADSVVTRREQKRAQYQQVKAHVQKEDGRVQAYGWSLPKKLKGNGAQVDKMKDLPVPVFLRPLDEKEASMKLWCAAGVNLSGGKTRDGGLLVGASVFYSDLSGSEGPQKEAGSRSSLEQLDRELEEQQKELQHQEQLSSLVWICTSTQSTSKVLVIDANQPGNILESFVVCPAHVLCVTSVPGARETDYPAGEEGPPPEAGPAADGGSSAADGGAASGDSILGGITVVGCEAEGSAAAPQAAETGEEREEVEGLQRSRTAAAEEAGQSLRSVHACFSDPLGARGAGDGSEHGEGGPPRDGAESNPDQEEERDLTMEEAQRMSSVQPTMWLGAQDGHLYVHSSVAHWRRCLHSIKLKESVFGIVHVKGRVLVSMSDGTIAIFRRGADGQWDLSRYHLLDLGRPQHSIRCMTVVHDEVWCGYRNKIYVVQPKAMKVEKSFDAPHPRKDTHGHLQDVDIEPYVSKMLGTGKLGFSFVRITALMVSCNRLWIGTGNGVIISIPLTETNKASKAAGNLPGGVVRLYGDDSGDKVTAGTVIPFCSMAQAQLCFHGHRDAVKFFAAVPGHAVPPSSSGGDAAAEQSDASCQEGTKSVLVMSGGEGYIDFRMGDEDGEAQEADAALLKLQASPVKAERSHLIVWQVLLGGE